MAEQRLWKDCSLRSVLQARIVATHPELDTFDYDIEWGDGITESLVDKPGVLDVYHEYSTGGTFNPNISAKTHQYGCSSGVDSIILTDAPIYVLGGSLEIAGSTAERVSVNIGDSVEFSVIPVGCRTGTCHVMFVWGDGTVTSIHRDVEMGETVTETHIYSSAYTFNFQLKIIGANFLNNNFPTSNFPVRFVEVS